MAVFLTRARLERMLSKTDSSSLTPPRRDFMKQPPSLLDPPATAETRARMSLAARLLNVFAVPGEVFTEIKTSPHSVSNWLVPGILGAFVGAISVLVMLSQPTVQKQVHERQAALLDKAAKSGKLTSQERFAAEQFTGPTAVKVFGIAGAVVGSF